MSHDAANTLVEFANVYFGARVLGFYIAAHLEVVAIFGNLRIVNKC